MIDQFSRKAESSKGSKPVLSRHLFSFEQFPVESLFNALELLVEDGFQPPLGAVRQFRGRGRGQVSVLASKLVISLRVLVGIWHGVADLRACGLALSSILAVIV